MHQATDCVFALRQVAVMKVPCPPWRVSPVAWPRWGRCLKLVSGPSPTPVNACTASAAQAGNTDVR